MSSVQESKEVTQQPNCSSTEGEKVRTWPHFLADNTPTIVTYVLGTVILFFFHFWAAVAFGVYCIVSTVLIWRFVCTHCQYFGGVCQCGFSLVATRLFERGDEGKIESTKKLMAVLVFPCWVVPFIVAIFILVTSFSWTVLWLFVAFVIVAVAVTPYISWKIGCCDIWRYLSWKK
jgi:hypothetical protein